MPFIRGIDAYRIQISKMKKLRRGKLGRENKEVGEGGGKVRFERKKKLIGAKEENVKRYFFKKIMNYSEKLMI